MEDAIVKKKCKQKKEAYLDYRTMRTPQSYNEYQIIRHETAILVRGTKNHYWEIFSKGLVYYITKKRN